MIALCDFTESNGATGYVPGTHKYIIDSNHVNNIGWEIFFRDNYQQFIAPIGSIISWHPRLLHSTMPNKTGAVRRALLLHASEKGTIRKLGTMDPHINHNLRNL
jgi:ectoine hydroxylase-related dioxygenase (phytanoyl-CoA dioxygenase family)